MRIKRGLFKGAKLEEVYKCDTGEYRTTDPCFCTRNPTLQSLRTSRKTWSIRWDIKHDRIDTKDLIVRILYYTAKRTRKSMRYEVDIVTTWENCLTTFTSHLI